jgi:MoaA/NifB/PqqE/SkfB family radical SAM enzyme
MMHLKSQFAILLGIIHGERAYSGPPYVVLDIIRRCNIRCTGCFFHCPQGRKPMPGDLAVDKTSFALVDKICEELPRVGTREIILLGEGEPFLHPEMIDFIRSFKRVGVKVQVFTNGTLFTEKLSQELVKSGLDVLNVTFWAVNEREHEACHPQASPKLLRKRTAGVELFMKYRSEAGRKSPSLNLAFPINKDNRHNLQGRLELIESLRPDSVSLGVFRDWGGEHQRLMLTPEDVDSLAADLRPMRARLKALDIAMNPDDYLSPARLGPEVWRKMPCYAGWFQTYIKVDGTVLPCGHCYHAVGNMLKQPFETIWNGPLMRDFRRRGVRLRSAGPLPPSCDCANCCQIKDNIRIQRVLRWLTPLTPRDRC